MPVGEVVRAEAAEIVAVRAEVVVDDVEEHGEAERVRGIDQAAQIVRRAVAAGRREQADAVVAPVARAGEVGHRHQLDGGDAEVAQIGQPLGHGGERPFGRERADVQLVDDEVCQAARRSIRVGPVRRHAGRRPPTGRARRRAESARPGRGTARRRRADSGSGCRRSIGDEPSKNPSADGCSANTRV